MIKPHAVLALSLLASCAAAPSEQSAEPTAQDGAATGAAFLARNATAKGVVTTASGLQYSVVKSGPRTGQSPVAGDQVTFDYEGKLLSGETFDSSFARGAPLTGDIDRFVPGFTEALKLMRPGDEWIVWIPPQLGYGSDASGPIPGNSVLRFRMALRQVGTTPG